MDMRTKFYWMQHFPAGKKTIIEHSYKPITGQTFFTPNDLISRRRAAAAGSKTIAWMARRSPLIRKRMSQHKAAAQDDGMLRIYSTDFILKTANNWKGGIGKTSPDHRQVEAGQYHFVVLERRPEKDGADAV